MSTKTDTIDTLHARCKITAMELRGMKESYRHACCLLLDAVEERLRAEHPPWGKGIGISGIRVRACAETGEVVEDSGGWWIFYDAGGFRCDTREQGEAALVAIRKIPDDLLDAWEAAQPVTYGRL